MRDRIAGLDDAIGVVGALGRRKTRGCAVEYGHQFSVNINPGVVVIVLVRSGHAKANENYGSIHVGVGVNSIAGGGEFFALAQSLRLAVAHKFVRGLLGCQSDFAQRYGLEPGTVHASRLHAYGFQFSGNVLRRDLVAAGAGTSTLEQAVREKTHVSADCVRSDAIHGGVGGALVGARQLLCGGGGER